MATKKEKKWKPEKIYWVLVGPTGHVYRTTFARTRSDCEQAAVTYLQEPIAEIKKKNFRIQKVELRQLS